MKQILFGLTALACCAAISMADQVTVQQGQRRGTPARSNAQRIPRQEAVSVGMSPAMLALATPLQVPTEDYDVYGLRINILYGECVNFAGLDISGLAGRARGNGDGLQIAGIANIVNGDSTALQIGPVNYVEGDLAGMQIGVANLAAWSSGSQAQTWQIGAFNGGGLVKGFQLGVINYAESMVGVQLGLINVIANKDVAFLPIINAAF